MFGWLLILRKNPRAWLSIVVFFVLIYTLLVAVYNWKFMMVVLESSITLGDKVKVLFVTVAGAWSVFGWFGFVLVVLFSSIAAVYVTLLGMWIRYSRSMSKRDIANGFAGSILGFLGLGCVACGTLVITPFLTLVGAGGLLTLLPLAGLEFLIVATVWLGVSTLIVGKKLNERNVCPVE